MLTICFLAESQQLHEKITRSQHAESKCWQLVSCAATKTASILKILAASFIYSFPTITSCIPFYIDKMRKILG